MRTIRRIDDAYTIHEDGDGVRFLLTTDSSALLPGHVWTACCVESVAYLVLDSPAGFCALVSEEVGPTTPRGHALAWMAYGASQPTYRTMMATVEPEPQTSFVHLHTHSEMSLLDGYSSLDEIITAVVADHQPAIGITDHGNVGAHPMLQAKAQAAGLGYVFGLEAYFVPDRHRRPVEVEGVEGARTDHREVRSEYMHLTLWAMDDEGLRNLWAMSTESFRDGLYDGKPRLDWDTLERLNTGVLCGTGCLRGPVARPLADSGDLDTARQNMARLLGIFGDRLYAEIHANSLPQQMQVNEIIQILAAEMGVVSIACVDSHYSSPDDAPMHEIWLAMQTAKTLVDDSTLFQGGQQYHMKTRAEVLDSLAYLGADYATSCVDATVAVADRCTATISGATATPTYSKPSAEHPDPRLRDEERLWELVAANWDRKVAGKPDEHLYEPRVAREMALLVSKAYCGYYLVVWDYVGWAKAQGCLVGPSRGSGGGSLVAYLLDITELDPIEHDLIFERFLTSGRVSLPDFDIDFPASWRDRLEGYVTDRWGNDHVAKIGTVVRLQSKGAIDNAIRVLKPILGYEVSYPEIEAVKALIDEADSSLAGAHLPWAEICEQFEGDLAPVRAKYPEVFGVIDSIVGRVKTLSKHPAGMVISTDAPLTTLPMRVADDGVQLITQFDQEALELLGYVKFDLLTLRTLDTIQATVDFIRARYPHVPQVYDWREEYLDPQVWEEVAMGHTLGLFQVETKSGTRLTKQLQPHSVKDLADVMTLVRPGPTRSGLTKMYLARRAGHEVVTFPDERMAEVLRDTYGAIIYQEQVMAATMTLAGYDENEADAVRKILGKKLVDKVLVEGEKFVRRATENGMGRQAAQMLWDQMSEFARYSFAKAHAYGYSVLGVWTAWFKYHYPVEFLAAALGTVKDERKPEFIAEARRMGYAVLPPDINISAVLFTPDETSIRYGLANVRNIGEDAAATIVAGQPYASYADFTDRIVQPTGSRVNRGHLGALISAGAFDSLVGNRKAVEMQLHAEVTGAATRCVFKIDGVTNPVTDLPCTYDWATEPDPPYVLKGRGKKRIKEPKPPPKRCTVACRSYTPPPPISSSTLPSYTDSQVRAFEVEMLGSWLTGSPFDVIPTEVLEEDTDTGDEVEAGPPGEYVVAGFIEVPPRERKDANDNLYAFVALTTPQGSLDCIVFASRYQFLRPDLAKGNLVVGTVIKNERGYQLYDAYKIMPATH